MSIGVENINDLKSVLRICSLILTVSKILSAMLGNGTQNNANAWPGRSVVMCWLDRERSRRMRRGGRAAQFQDDWERYIMHRRSCHFKVCKPLLQLVSDVAAKALLISVAHLDCSEK
jgi:hypothetical protein